MTEKPKINVTKWLPWLDGETPMCSGDVIRYLENHENVPDDVKDSLVDDRDYHRRKLRTAYNGAVSRYKRRAKKGKVPEFKTGHELAFLPLPVTVNSPSPAHRKANYFLPNQWKLFCDPASVGAEQVLNEKTKWISDHPEYVIARAVGDAEPIHPVRYQASVNKEMAPSAPVIAKPVADASPRIGFIFPEVEPEMQATPYIEPDEFVSASHLQQVSDSYKVNHRPQKRKRLRWKTGLTALGCTLLLTAALGSYMYKTSLENSRDEFEKGGQYGIAENANKTGMPLEKTLVLYTNLWDLCQNPETPDGLIEAKVDEILRYQGIHDSHMHAKAKMAHGTYYVKKNEHKKGIRLLKEALPIFLMLDAAGDVVVTELMLTEANFYLENFSQSQAWLDRARDRNRSHYEADIFFWQGRLQFADGDLEDAINLTKRADELYKAKGAARFRVSCHTALSVYNAVEARESLSFRHLVEARRLANKAKLLEDDGLVMAEYFLHLAFHGEKTDKFFIPEDESTRERTEFYLKLTDLKGE